MAFPQAWNRVCALVIQGQYVESTLTNFPVWVTAACLPAEMLTLGGVNAAQSDGGDIRFSSDPLGANQLSCEIVIWQQTANPSNSTAEIYVLVPLIVAAQNTPIYVWYSISPSQAQPAASAPFGSQSVWANNFAGRWHFKGNLFDSTSNGFNGTAVSGPAIGYGVTFNGSQSVTASASSVLTASIMSLSYWVRPNILTASYSCLYKYEPFVPPGPGGHPPAILANGWHSDVYNSLAELTVAIANIVVNASGGPFTVNGSGWVRVTITFSGTSVLIYANGALVSTASLSAAVADSGTALNFGRTLAGSMYEIAIATGVSWSSAWISASYQNESYPQSFVSASGPYTPGYPAYLRKITSEYQAGASPNMLAWLQTNIQLYEDMLACLSTFTVAFNPATAIGAQLDVLGAIIGQSRTVTFQPTGSVSPVLDDVTYRILLQARILQNHWNGKIDSLFGIWQAIFPGGTLIVNDAQNMTVAIYVAGAFTSIIKDLITNGYILPRPQTVQYTYSFATLPMLGFDRDDAYVQGFDGGYFT